MKKAVLAIAAVVTLGAANPHPAQAEPGGCLKYGLGGAIAGHFAGGHRWKGAAAGCALGYWTRRRHQEAEGRFRDRDYDRGRSFDRDRSGIARRDERSFERDFDQRRSDPSETGTVRRRYQSDEDIGSALRRQREDAY
jgi:hypothetical protein